MRRDQENSIMLRASGNGEERRLSGEGGCGREERG